MTGGEKETSDALRVALATEEEGLEMYRKAAAKASNPMARKMFLGLAKDETNHITMIETIAEGMGMSAAVEVAHRGTPRERLSTIFSEAKEEVTERLAATADEFDALRIAIQFEDGGYKSYTEAAQQASDENQRALFEKLAQEESEHHRILESTRDYLEQTGKWFLWEEWALLTGDMSAGG